MPMSLRLDSELENRISQAAKKLNINKTEVIRKCLKKSLSEIVEKTCSPYSVYCKLEGKIPFSGLGYLSVNHREEVLKRIKNP